GASLAMKERLVMFAAASGAVILFLTMFISSERGFGIGREVPRPTSAERGGNGYLAAVRWLAAGRVPVVSLQESLAKLSDRADLVPTGNVMVVTLPVTSAFGSDEYRALER